MLPEWLIRAVVGVCGRDLHTNTNLKGLKMSLFYDAFLSFSSQIRGQETITRPKKRRQVSKQRSGTPAAPRCFSGRSREQPAARTPRGALPPSSPAGRHRPPGRGRCSHPSPRSSAWGEPAWGAQLRREPAVLGRLSSFLFFFFFFPNRSVYLNVYFITSLQHIIPTLPRAEFCHLFLILIFCNDSLKSLSL